MSLSNKYITQEERKIRRNIEKLRRKQHDLTKEFFECAKEIDRLNLIIQNKYEVKYNGEVKDLFEKFLKQFKNELVQ